MNRELITKIEVSYNILGDFVTVEGMLGYNDNRYLKYYAAEFVHHPSLLERIFSITLDKKIEKAKKKIKRELDTKIEKYSDYSRINP